MAAVIHAETFVDIDFAEAGNGFGEIIVVAFFFGVVTDIFAEHHFTGFQAGAQGDGFFGKDIVGEFYFSAEEFFQSRGDGTDRHFRHSLPFGTTQMGKNHKRRALFQNIVEGGNAFFHAHQLGDVAFFIHRHIIIGAEQNSFAFEITVADT